MTAINRHAASPRTRDPEGKRNALLEAGRALFVEKGFEATTTRMIAAAAGVSEGVLFHQFGSKLALFSELMRDFAENGTQAFLPGNVELLTSEQVVLSVLAFVESDHDLFRLIYDNQAMLAAQDDQIWLNYLNHWIKLKKARGFFDQLAEKWQLAGR